MTEPLSQIGRVKKAHGLHGELKVDIDPAYLEDFMSTTVLYLGDERQQIPYFLENRRSLPQPIIKLEEVDSRDEAELLRQPYIFIPTAQLAHEPESYVPDEFHYSFLTGFSVYNPAGDLLGKIDRLEAFPQQEMGVLEHKDKEMLVPLNDTFIVEVEEASSKVIMDFPEGLLDL